MQKIVKEVRSARANYNLPNSAKTEGKLNNNKFNDNKMLSIKPV